MNPFSYRDGRLFCEEVSVADIAREYGTPVWVYSRAKLLHEYREIRDAFAACNPVICFSVKSNSNLSVLRTLAEDGCSFDVVSGGELYRVEKSGGDPTRVVFAGVGKTDAEIRSALASRILMFNVESEAELDNIGRIAGEMQVVAPVALRLNPDVDAKTHAKTTTGKKGNKFGMDIERHNQLAAKVLAHPHLELKGIHMHLGSPIYTTDPYEQAVAKAATVVRELRAAGHPLTFLNLGGGFALSYRHNDAPPVADYARVIVPAVQEMGCQLALEPGRRICGNAAILVTEVIYTKREGGKLFVIQDGAMNDLVRPAMYDSFHAIWPVTSDLPLPADFEADAPGCERTDVVGPICESSDYFAKQRPLPPLSAGDQLAIFSAGAYGTVMSSNYNSRPRGAEVMVDGSQVQVIRRRETYADLVAAEL